MNRDIGKIVSECINNKMIQHYFMKKKDMNYGDNDLIRKNFSRMVGYCILFKKPLCIETYMSLSTRDSQRLFLKLMIADEIGIKEDEIEEKTDEINNYIFDNFIRDGYVFHAGNSKAIIDNMKNGLSYSDNLEEKMELLHIDSIFRKYGNDRPLGWGVLDINNKKNGWFLDNVPKNMLYYGEASPEWFSQFCGENMCYSWSEVPGESRHGYPNRDYDACYLAITRLIEKNYMNEDDKKEVIDFFNKCWEKYSDTEPYLLFIPAASLKEDIASEKEQYLYYFGDNMFDEVIDCHNGCFGLNRCCDKTIFSEDLSCVNLSPILPKYKIGEDLKKKEIPLQECIRKLNGLDMSLLLEAEEMLENLSTKNDGKKL